LSKALSNGLIRGYSEQGPEFHADLERIIESTIQEAMKELPDYRRLQKVVDKKLEPQRRRVSLKFRDWIVDYAQYLDAPVEAIQNWANEVLYRHAGEAKHRFLAPVTNPQGFVIAS
jgi:hypothetical protein